VRVWPVPVMAKIPLRPLIIERWFQRGHFTKNANLMFMLALYGGPS